MEFDSSEGWLCLDFANTLQQDLEGQDIEMLNSYDDLVRWGLHSGILLDDDQANALRQEAERHPAQARSMLDRAIHLRGVVFRVFAAIAAECVPDDADMAALDVELHEAFTHLHPYFDERGFAWQWDDGGSSLAQILWPVAWSAAELMNTDSVARVRECASDRCTYLFIDTSRNHSRRWCSMQSCGNRDKVRRFTERHRHDETAS